MALVDNKAKIQALLDGINALPQAGGGGGLPNGVSALASGTFTLTTDIIDSIPIAHGLGVKPNFYVVMVETDLSESTAVVPMTVYCTSIRKRVYDKNIGTIVYGSVMTGETIEQYGYYHSLWYLEEDPDFPDDIDDIKFELWAGNASPLKAGHTYRWVCGVIDGIQ